MDHARKLKFSSYVHLPPINKIFQYLYAVQYNRGNYSMGAIDISSLEHVRMVILSSYVLLACVNPIYKYGHAWMLY